MSSDTEMLDYLRNIDTRPGPNAGRSIDPTKPGPDADRIAELQGKLNDYDDRARKGPLSHQDQVEWKTLRAGLARLRNEQDAEPNYPPQADVARQNDATSPGSQDVREALEIALDRTLTDVVIHGALDQETADALRSLLKPRLVAALAQSDAQPVGWQLVPKEPTLEMLRALYSALSAVVLEPTARNFYANMLAKAPTAPHSPDASGLIEAAEWHEEMANVLRKNTRQSRQDWKETSYRDEEAEAELADNRRDEAKAIFHEECAAALRTRAADRSTPRSDKGGA